MTDKQEENEVQKVLKAAVEKASPISPLDYTVLLAELQAKEGCSQKTFAEATGVAERTIRKYKADHLAAYNERFAEAEAELEAKRSPKSSSRKLTESQLDQLVDVLITDALKPTATVQQRQQLINFAGIKDLDLLSLTKSKGTKMSWFLKNNLDDISSYMDTRSLGIALYESNLLNLEDDPQGKKNINTFLQKDISDTDFKETLLYWGLTFMSLINRVEHPDLQLLAANERFRHLHGSTGQLPDKLHELRPWAKGTSVKDGPETTKDMYELLQEINEWTDEETAKNRAQGEQVKSLTEPPVIEKVDLLKRESHHQEELKLIITLQDSLDDIFGKGVFTSDI